MPEGFDMADISALPSWEQHALAARSLVRAFAEEDPEDTLMVQLTTPEFGLITLGLLVLPRLFPEFYGVRVRLMEKLADLSVAQEFFRPPSDEGSTVDEE